MNMIRPTTITDAMLVSSDVPETDYDEYDAGTTYAEDDYVMETASGVHKVYQSLQGANTGHALTDTLWWLEISPTNRWKVFDTKVQTQTSQAASMEYVLEPGLFDAVALLNLEATSVQIVIDDPVEGEVYNETTNLVTTIPYSDWYLYFFEPSIRDTDIVKTDMCAIGTPPFTNAQITITITNTAGNAECGGIVLGMQAYIGAMAYGAEAGNIDYSVKSADDFGNYTITERSYSKRMNCPLEIRNLVVDESKRLLDQYRATPMVFVGHEDYTMFIIYGFIKNYSIVMAHPAFSRCDLEIEGLT
jgi:hypothetical protein